MDMQKDNPLVSVIIPIYNRYEMGVKAIESALNQTYTHIEVVVGDNCSTDGTFGLLQNDYSNNEKVVLFQNSENLGPVRNWIKCLNRAKGEYIKILWSDDMMTEQFIEEAMKVLLENDKVGFVYSKVRMVDEQGSSDLANEKYMLGNTGVYDADVFYDALIKYHSAPSSPGCALFRRDALFVNTDFDGCNEVNAMVTGAGVDLLMFLLAFQNKPYFYYINEAMNLFREHGGSISISNPDVPKGYMCAKNYYFNKHPNKKYIEWIKAENSLLIGLNKMPPDVADYCVRNKMVSTGMSGLGYKYRIIINHYMKKLSGK